MVRPKCIPQDLDIGEWEVYYNLYVRHQATEADLARFGLGMPTTFAEHLSRINSRDPAVVDAEKAWYEALIECTHFLTSNTFRQNDPNAEFHSSQTTAQPTSDFPTPFMSGHPLVIPRLRPYRSAVVPGFALTNVHDPEADYGYSKEELIHCLRLLATVSPYSTFHGVAAGKKGKCGERLNPRRPLYTIGELCPDLVSTFCDGCNAEAFVVCNYLLAHSGYNGVAHAGTMSLAVLVQNAKSFLSSSMKVPVEVFHWAFAAQTFADNRQINGVEVQAWEILKKRRNFEHLRSWKPQTPARAERMVKDEPSV